MDCTLPRSPHKNNSEKVRKDEDNEKEISGPAALFGDGPEPDSDDSLGGRHELDMDSYRNWWKILQI